MTAHCFFLREPPRGERAWLAAEDEEHARRVLRLDVGDAVLGLDGVGGRWPLKVERRDRHELVFVRDGEPARVPAPGELGAGAPWLQVAVSLPRAGRADEMFGRLVQLGAAEIVPLSTERTQAYARELPPPRRARFERLAREACKQSRRAWLPRLGEPTSMTELAATSDAASMCTLSPRARISLSTWAAAAPPGTRERPWRVLIGAEGGFTDAELAALERSRATSVSLGPHILRIETAAEAAAAILVQAVWSAENVTSS